MWRKKSRHYTSHIPSTCNLKKPRKLDLKWDYPKWEFFQKLKTTCQIGQPENKTLYEGLKKRCSYSRGQWGLKTKVWFICATAKRWWWRKEHSFLIRYSESPKQLIVKMPYPDVNNVTGCLYIHFYSLSPVAVPHESKNEIRDFLFPVSIVIWLNEAAERILRS